MYLALGLWTRCMSCLVGRFRLLSWEWENTACPISLAFDINFKFLLFSVVLCWAPYFCFESLGLCSTTGVERFHFRMWTSDSRLRSWSPRRGRGGFLKYLLLCYVVQSFTKTSLFPVPGLSSAYWSLCFLRSPNSFPLFSQLHFSCVLCVGSKLSQWTAY